MAYAVASEKAAFMRTYKTGKGAETSMRIGALAQILIPEAFSRRLRHGGLDPSVIFSRPRYPLPRVFGIVHLSEYRPAIPAHSERA